MAKDKKKKKDKKKDKKEKKGKKAKQQVEEIDLSEEEEQETAEEEEELEDLPEVEDEDSDDEDDDEDDDGEDEDEDEESAEDEDSDDDEDLPEDETPEANHEPGSAGAIAAALALHRLKIPDYKKWMADIGPAAGLNKKALDALVPDGLDALQSCGTLLRSMRRKNKMSQEDLADICGIAQPHISATENSRSIPSQKTLDALAKALACKADDLKGFDFGTRVEVASGKASKKTASKTKASKKKSSKKASKKSSKKTKAA